MTKRDDREITGRFNHMQNMLRYHEGLLCDEARNRAFYAALKAYVTSDTSVLDIGTGTGIWSIIAAKLGAKRVTAIEKDRLLIPIIQNLARENRVADRIEIVEGDSREINLEGKYDIIVSETIGNEGFDEDLIPIMLDARKRFLKRGGVLIPGTISVVTSAAHLKGPRNRMPSGLPVESRYLAALALNIPVRLEDKRRLKILSDPVELISVDLASAKSLPALTDMTASWKLDDVSNINCFVIWAEANLSKDARLKTIETSSWMPIVYRIKPFDIERGEIEFRLSLSGKEYHWSASAVVGQKPQKQAYAPVFAYTSLEAAIQMAEARAALADRK